MFIYVCEENNSLSVIEKIVEKSFTQKKKLNSKKRLISSEFVTNVTDLDELTLISIKKKKQSEKNSRRKQIRIVLPKSLVNKY